MSPEVLIYIQTVKRHFNESVEAQEYFSIKGNEEIFYKDITEISQKNYDEYGDPELSIEQFEEVRRKIYNSVGAENKIIATFMNVGDLGHISLN